MHNIYLRGGTGNILFQINFGLFLKSQGFRISFVVPGARNAFPVDKEILSFITAQELPFCSERRFFKKFFGLMVSGTSYEEDITQCAQSSDIFRHVRDIHGYWQNPAYFGIHSNPIYRWISDRAVKSNVLRDFSLELSASKHPTCIIHIRRGDYFSSPTNLSIHGILKIDYFERAAKRILEVCPEVSFLLATDSLSWVKDNLPDVISGRCMIIPSEDPRDAVDILSVVSKKCCHAILSNSSFSWWMAYLIEKNAKVLSNSQTCSVYRPKYWYGEGHLRTVNPSPPHWIALD